MLSPISPAAKLTDRRVDRRLLRQGYDLAACQLFYSPLTSWLLSLGLLLLATLPVAGCWAQPLMLYAIGAAAYFGLGYLVAARLNTSFALTTDQLVCLNVNPPFRCFECFEVAQVAGVRIGKSRLRYLAWLFGIVGGNYMAITANGSTRRFYCIAIEVDTFDENWTESTLDDLHVALQKHGVLVQFDLELS